MNWILFSNTVNAVPVYLLVGVAIAHASLYIRRKKSESVFAFPLFPNRAYWGWRNDSDEDRHRTLVDRAYGGYEKPTLDISTYYLFTAVTWPARLALNVCIVLWMMVKTCLIYLVFAAPIANYMLRQWCDIRRPD